VNNFALNDGNGIVEAPPSLSSSPSPRSSVNDIPRPRPPGEISALKYERATANPPSAERAGAL